MMWRQIIIFVLTMFPINGQIQFKMLKTYGQSAGDTCSYSFKCKTISFSENSVILCSAKCSDPQSSKWWKSEFYNKVESDTDLAFSGLFCKYFTFSNGQCSTCLRSYGFNPTSSPVPVNHHHVGININAYKTVDLTSASVTAGDPYDPSNRPPNNIIDGNGETAGAKCAIAQAASPYFRVDLQTPMTFWGVNLLSRADTGWAAPQLAKFKVYTSNDPITSGTPSQLCHHFTREGTGHGEWLRLLCKKEVTARYIFIQMEPKSDNSAQQLVICEMQVFQPRVSFHHVDLSKAVITLMDQFESQRPAALLNDKLVQSAGAKCSIALKAATGKPSVIVDFGGSEVIHALELMARSDGTPIYNQLFNFTVYVTEQPAIDVNKVCVHEPDRVMPGMFKKYTCTTEMSGRYVIIEAQNNPNHFTICALNIEQNDSSSGSC